MKGVLLLLVDAYALREAVRWRRLLALRLSLELRLPQIAYPRQERLQSTVDSQTKACGCAEGAASTALFLAIYAVAPWLDMW
jgi:hypothetical protein